MQADELQREIDRIKALEPEDFKAQWTAQLELRAPAEIKSEVIEIVIKLMEDEGKQNAINVLKTTNAALLKLQLIADIKTRDPMEVKSERIEELELLLDLAEVKQ